MDKENYLYENTSKSKSMMRHKFPSIDELPTMSAIKDDGDHEEEKKVLSLDIDILVLTISS